MESRNYYKKRPFKGNFSRGGARKRRGYNAPKIDIIGFIDKVNKNVQEVEIVKTLEYKDLNVDVKLKDNIVSKGFKNLTPIQDKIIPLVLDNKDVIGLSNTGTGKTAAYLIPVLDKIYKSSKTNALILAPTRELALQINAEFMSLRKNSNIFSVVLIGGENIERQKRSLKSNHNVIVATPGRLIDLINRKSVYLDKFNILVLDEVDRMLDMGFVEDIKKIIRLLPQKRQSLFFSATLNGKVEELINSNSQNAIKVDVTKSVTSVNVEQVVVNYKDDKQKIELLHDLLIKEHFTKVLIFKRTKVGVRDLEKELNTRGFKVESIHGNKRQNARQSSLKKFKSNNVNILIATDVASRGLDINDISHVINFDVPDSFDDYIHRIGRTGRADKKGQAITFVKN